MASARTLPGHASGHGSTGYCMSTSKLFTPGRIGPVEIRNRIVMPSMTTRLADAEGFVTDASIAYFRARAAGGAGLITAEMASPEKAGRHRRHELGIYDDRFVPGLRRLVDNLHAHGAKAAVQLGHAGGHTRLDITGEPPVAPSAIPQFVFEVTGATIVPEAMTRDRIETCVEAFASAAARAAKAGFDCVEIHAAHGYLISQFLCPAENLRGDEYGGSLENRARFGLDILRRVKAAAPGLGVIFRLSADDLFPAGMPFREGLLIAQWAAKAGADAIHVSAGHYQSVQTAQIMTPPMTCEEGIFLHFAAAVKQAVAVPVIAVGRLGNPRVAAAAIDENKADFVALGRSQIADPQWVAKASRGKPVRRCLACNTCVNDMRGGNPISCYVNAAAGHELEFETARPSVEGPVAVIGAGPAGMTYASLIADVASVTVFEHEALPGGALRYAGKAPLFQEVEAAEGPLLDFIDDLERACRDKGVVFRYGADPIRNPELLEGFATIIVATGARYLLGLEGLVKRSLKAGLWKHGPLRKLFSSEALRHFLYYRARYADPAVVDRLRACALSTKIVVIGDASKAGKGQAAIRQAFAAAFGKADFDTPRA